MKKTIILFIINLFLSSMLYAYSYKFEITEYSIAGSNISSTKNKAIKSDSDKIDVCFYVRNFGIPMILPDSFANKKYINVSITKDNKGNGLINSYDKYIQPIDYNKFIKESANKDTSSTRKISKEPDSAVKNIQLDEYAMSWTNKYDSLSRLIEYSFSSCIACDLMAYWYIVTYNKFGQIFRIKNIINHNNSIELFYDDNGSVCQLNYYEDYYNSLVLRKTIILIK